MYRDIFVLRIASVWKNLNKFKFVSIIKSLDFAKKYEKRD